MLEHVPQCKKRAREIQVEGERWKRKTIVTLCLVEVRGLWGGGDGDLLLRSAIPSPST